MIGRGLVLALALAVFGAPAAAVASTWNDAPTDDVVLRKDENAGEIVAVDDDDDGLSGSGDGTDGGDASGDSNDGTGSGHTSVSRDTDRSRGDLTRDRTNDGPGRDNRDWTGGNTNDWTRNDTR